MAGYPGLGALRASCCGCVSSCVPNHDTWTPLLVCLCACAPSQVTRTLPTHPITPPHISPKSVSGRLLVRPRRGKDPENVGPCTQVFHVLSGQGNALEVSRRVGVSEREWGEAGVVLRCRGLLLEVSREGQGLRVGARSLATRFQIQRLVFPSMDQLFHFQPRPEASVFDRPFTSPLYTDSNQVAIGELTGQDGFDERGASRFLLGPGDAFLVPPHNTYRLFNHSAKAAAEVFWAIVKVRGGLFDVCVGPSFFPSDWCLVVFACLAVCVLVRACAVDEGADQLRVVKPTHPFTHTLPSTNQ